MRERRLTFWLTRQRNGDYLLSIWRPILHPVGRSAHKDAYLQPGEPVGLRHLCADGVHAILRGEHLQPLESVRVRVSIEALMETKGVNGDPGP
jgi:hypothetical protein